MFLAAKQDALPFLMMTDELAHVIDGQKAVHVTFAQGRAQVNSPRLPRIRPSQPGFFAAAFSISNGSSNPGRCHGIETSLSRPGHRPGRLDQLKKMYRGEPFEDGPAKMGYWDTG